MDRVYNDIELLLEKAAVRECIDKWQDIRKGIGIDVGADNCALCNLHDNNCNDCSYNISYGCCYNAGKRYSIRTNAYHDWAIHLSREHNKTLFKYHHVDCFKYKLMVLCPECRKLAQNVENQLEHILHCLNAEFHRRVEYKVRSDAYIFPPYINFKTGGDSQ